MITHMKTLIKEDRGTIAADWISFSGGLAILTLVMVSAAQQEVDRRIASMPSFAVVAPSYD
jgi:hypothetical protein